MKDLIDIMKETAVKQTTLIITKNHEVSIRKFFEEYGIKAEVKIDVDIKSIDIEKFEKNVMSRKNGRLCEKKEENGGIKLTFNEEDFKE